MPEAVAATQTSSANPNAPPIWKVVDVDGVTVDDLLQGVHRKTKLAAQLRECNVNDGEVDREDEMREREQKKAPALPGFNRNCSSGIE